MNAINSVNNHALKDVALRADQITTEDCGFVSQIDRVVSLLKKSDIYRSHRKQIMSVIHHSEDYSIYFPVIDFGCQHRYAVLCDTVDLFEDKFFVLGQMKKIEHLEYLVSVNSCAS